MMLSMLVYLIPTFFLLRKKKIGEVGLYFGRERPRQLSRRKTGNGSGKASCLLKQKGLQSVKANREINTSIRRIRLMACTTILVGKKASYDGSTMIARNDDSGSGHFTAKKFVVVQPEEHPAVYRSVLSHVESRCPATPCG